MSNFLHSLLSRKFLLAVSGVVAALANHQYDLAAGLVAAYVAAEAHVDAKRAASHVTAATDAAVAASADPRFQ